MPASPTGSGLAGFSPDDNTLLARNAVASLTTVAVPLVLGGASIPFILRTLGSERFGVLAIVWVLLSASQTFDLGITKAIVQRSSIAFGSGDHDEVSSILAAGSLFQLGLGSIAALAIFLSVPSFFGQMEFATKTVNSEALAIVPTLALLAPLALFSNAFYGILAGAQRFTTIAIVRVPLNSSMFVLPAIGGLLGWGLVGIVWGLVAVRSLGLVAYIASSRSFISVAVSRHDLTAAMRSLLAFGSWAGVTSVVGVGLVYSDRLIVGAVVGAVGVGIYAVAHELVSRALVVPSAIAAPLVPYLARRWAGGARGTAVDYLSIGLLLAAMPLVALTVVAAEPMLSLLTGGSAQPEGADVLRLFLVGVGPNAVAQINLASLHAMDRPRAVAVLHVLEVIPYLACTFLLVQSYGLKGAAIAWSVRACIDSAALMWLRAGGASALRQGHKEMLLTLCGYLTMVGVLFALVVAISGPVLLFSAGAVASALLVVVYSQWNRLGGFGLAWSAVHATRKPLTSEANAR